MASARLRQTDQLLHLWPRSGVGDVRLGQPGAAGLQNAVAKNVEAIGRVGVGVDGNRNAVLPGRGTIDIVQIQPHRIGIQLQQLAVLLGGGHHGIERRLTGKHETCSYREFRYGVSDRGASVRIPWQVEKEGKGYIEDRRPNANMDPYVVARLITDTVCSALS